jgi:UDP-N-acetylmuramyl pentapeptide synthase
LGPTWRNYITWLEDDLVDTIRDQMMLAPPPLISQWSTNSRTIRPGDWFVTLSGTNFEEPKFIGKSNVSSLTHTQNLIINYENTKFFAHL